MKQYKINQAYNSIKNLLDMKFPIKLSREIYNLSNILVTHFEFSGREQKKIIDSYGGKINPDGSISFGGKDEEMQMCLDDLNELMNSDVDINFRPITINEKDYSEKIISPSDIGNLDGFIIFE